MYNITIFVVQIGGGVVDEEKFPSFGAAALAPIKREEPPTKAAIVERILQEELEEKRVSRIYVVYKIV